MSHLLCRTANRQSLAAAPHGLKSLEPHDLRPRVDEVDAGAAQPPSPVPDLFGQLHPGDAVARPTDRSRRVAAKEGPDAPVAHGDEERRGYFAFPRPLREQRSAVRRGDDAPPPAGSTGRAPAKDDPAGVGPSIKRRPLPRGLEDGAGTEAARGVRAARNGRMCPARVRRSVAGAATGYEEKRCQQNHNAHDPSIAAPSNGAVTVTAACAARRRETASPSARPRTGRRAPRSGGARRPS